MSTPVNNNTGAAAGNGSGDAVSANGAVSSLFTTLLVAQIKNQDPLAPTDSAQFVNQLSQMSQVESLQALTTQTANSTSILTSLQALSLGNQVGNTVQVATDQLNLGTDKVQTAYTLASSAAPATLVLTGSDGHAHRVDLGAQGTGNHSYTLDPVALGLPAGNYQVSIQNESKQSSPLEVVAEVTGVRLASSGAMVQLGKLGEFSSQTITQFKGHAAAAAGA
ncbi:MAG: flagellar hook capping FlgD N-terminal domain-containing protein [Burkholderiaceae bacterium]